MQYYKGDNKLLLSIYVICKIQHEHDLKSRNENDMIQLFQIFSDLWYGSFYIIEICKKRETNNKIKIPNVKGKISNKELSEI